MFYNILKKEFKLIFRDIHALFVLFLMPTVFILIMSLALQNSFKDSLDIKYKVAIKSFLNEDTKAISSELNKSSFFESFFETDETKELLYSKNYDFVVVLDKDFKNKIEKNSKDFKIKIYNKANITNDINYILKSELVKQISKHITKEFYIKYEIDAKNLDNLENLIETNYIYKNKNESKKPNSVEQSVPAWLIFSMFFILIPISNTFINERNFGTIQRIKSINVSLWYILSGKIIPYFIVNQIQVLLMFLLAIYILPLFGLESLNINSYFMLVVCSFFISFAAISFALLIANISKTTEEATTIGGVSNIIFAALAGVMVPKFIMPEFMQKVGEFSPMSWALDSFLEVLIFGGDFSDISKNLFYLFLFGTICLILANLFLNRRI